MENFKKLPVIALRSMTILPDTMIPVSYTHLIPAGTGHFAAKGLQRRQKVLRRKGAACTQNGDLSGHRSPPAADPPEKQRKF